MEFEGRVGFIGLGNVGAKLAGNLLRNGVELVVFDLDADKCLEMSETGAGIAGSAAELAQVADVIITCLPSPAACAAVVEEMLPVLGAGKTWVEMSTTDADEVAQLAEKVSARGALAMECPVSGGCHRAATGNISIFVGGPREGFDAIYPVMQILGRRILHTGEIGTASKLKVMTNYLATANLLTLCEAMVTMGAAGLDMATTYEAIKISSGTSFVHETESQLILSGARDVNFTMDLVLKDIGLFQDLADQNHVPLELSPEVIRIMKDGQSRYGERAQSDRIIERLEELAGVHVLADGFPTELVDEEPPVKGEEVQPRSGPVLS
ncbi:2-(hydroxymethyl)glutarate dehydrogenase [Tritonibacter multivorans]|uniref:2-(Hydroxymethyl)glutarate dehydrogenase n=1 Tax=Tritonibacter multivorans TaxID=928856 RepID=A0A0P1GKM9_9RHOB|nr:NAD(P)-dependent oxidoreductase [Tritonibacter multivorans]MDA7419335.1 NAD(P)-dependent oxidoreductase [Tritonibacter multivorans]CUH75255.1 2-(hydroxymethyl)glutarate dehydrogenase [Tritonibacter multivorans]SFD22080.1 3-hydroxyisobutyrate dehydrogenase [Tritonibacter multivorans]